MCVVNPITMVEILSNYIYHEKVKENVKSIKKTTYWKEEETGSKSSENSLI